MEITYSSSSGGIPSVAYFRVIFGLLQGIHFPQFGKDSYYNRNNHVARVMIPVEFMGLDYWSTPL
jgi:hypothetical protein